MEHDVKPSRRNFIKTTATALGSLALPAGSARAFPEAPLPIVVEEEPSGGSVTVNPLEGVAGDFGTWTVTYRVGPKGIKQHGGIRVQLPDSWHAGIRNSANRLQASDPRADNYISGRCSPAGVGLRIWVEDEPPAGEVLVKSNRYSLDGRYERYVFVVRIWVMAGALEPGDALSVIYGDTSGGSKGMRASIIRTQPEPILAAVDFEGTGLFHIHPDRPTLVSHRLSLADQFFPWIISASVAPRHLFYANEMGWEHYKDDPAWQRDQKVFALYGAPDNLDKAYGFGDFPGPGECSNIGPSQRQTLYPALKRWFGIPIPASEPNDRRPESELASLTPAIARELKMAPVHELAFDLAVSKLNSTRAAMSRLDPDQRRVELRRKLAAKLGDIEPNRTPEAAVHWRRQLDGANIEAITLDIEPGIVVPLLVLRPSLASKPALPAVVAVNEGGKERFLAQRSDQIKTVLKAGIAVCLVDVRGTGETTSEMRRGLNSEEESAAATEFMLGNTLLGARLKDLRTVLAYLWARPDVDARKLALWGDSFAPVNPPRFVLDELIGWQVGPEIEYQAEPLGGLLALLGGLYEDKVCAIAARRGLAAYSSVLEDQFAYVPNDIVVPGILDVADVADIAAALAPRPFLVENFVDGRNRVVETRELRERFGLVYHSYREAPAQLRVRESSQEPSLVQWLAEVLK